MAQNEDLLIKKLDRFIRKYYKNQLIRGTIYSISALVLFYVSLVTLEYYGQFDSAVRTGLFWSYIIIASGILAKWIVTPLSRLNKLGKTISHEQAAGIIGLHFPDIEDKLLNTLQLRQQVANTAPQSRGLIEASIDQRTLALKPVPFGKAIDFKENRKYLRLAIPPFLFLFGLLLINANILSDGTDRLINHNETYEAPQPFSFVVLNDEFDVVEQDDFQLEVKLERNADDAAVPDDVFIDVDGNRFRLAKENNVNFNYLFKNVQQDTRFRLFADGVYSEEFTLSTLPNPLVLNFDVKLDYPDYIGKPDETLRNSGDLLVPAGTRVRWEFKTKDTEELHLIFGDSAYDGDRLGEDTYRFSQQLMRSKAYTITTANQFIQGRDSIRYRINVVADQYPGITMEEQQDSASTKRLYFRGDIKDDYGFRRMSFNYKFTKSEDSTRVIDRLETVEMPVNREITQEEYFHYWNLAELGIKAGEELEYYFEVWDNDGVNGSKSTRTQTNKFKAPTLDELSEKRDQDNEEMKDKMEEAIAEAQALQQEMDRVQQDLFNKKSMSWQDQQRMREMMQRQKDFQMNMELLRKENERHNADQQEYQEQDPELLAKQEQLQALFDELLTDEMKEMMKELEKLLEELDKDKVQEKLEEMNYSNEDAEKELERTLELFKQMEFEQDLEELIDELNELAEEQKELAEEALDKNTDSEELKEKQEELNEAFEEIKEEIDSLEAKNEELQNQREMVDTEEQEEAIDQEMQESTEQLGDDKKKKASESQQDAAEQMQQMAQQMQEMQAQEQEQQQQEDLDALRALLENIVQLSFDQEGLMDELKETRTQDPKYVELGQQQKKLRDDAKVIEDSLFALSKRIAQLESTINREISSIHSNMDKAMDNIANRSTGQASSRQQYVMTSLNELALLLDDALQQLQQAMANQMPGTGMCQKPGGSGKPQPGKGSKPSMGDMKGLQKSLSKQIEELKKELEKGKQPGQQPGEQPGMMPGGGSDGKSKGGFGMKPGMSEKIAKLAGQQEALRRQMEQMGQELNKDGTGAGDAFQKIAEEMEENEEDLINLDLDIETMMRQQEIMTRLLEAENAERERGRKEERESQEAKNAEISNPIEFFEYKRKKEKEVELLKTVPPTLKSYYKNKVNQYFNSFEE